MGEQNLFPSVDNIFRNNTNIDLLLELAIIEKTPLTFADIERELKYKNPQPWIRDTLKLLIRLDIIKEKDKIFNITRYKIDKKKLTDMIDELKVTNKWYNYFNKYHYITW